MRPPGVRLCARCRRVVRGAPLYERPAPLRGRVCGECRDRETAERAPLRPEHIRDLPHSAFR